MDLGNVSPWVALKNTVAAEWRTFWFSVRHQDSPDLFVRTPDEVIGVRMPGLVASVQWAITILLLYVLLDLILVLPSFVAGLVIGVSVLLSLWGVYRQWWIEYALMEAVVHLMEPDGERWAITAEEWAELEDDD